MDWVDPILSESAKEGEDDMSNLADGFTVRMCNRATSAQGETTPGSEVSDDKLLRRFGPE